MSNEKEKKRKKEETGRMNGGGISRPQAREPTLSASGTDTSLARRKFLKAALVTGLAVSVAPTIGRLSNVPVLSGLGRGAAAENSSVVKNIIVVLQQNHTFDNYFATYPGANGASNKCVPSVKGGTPNRCQFHDSSLAPAKMPNKWATAHADYDGGKMDGFYYTEGNIQTMGFYTRDDLSHYYNAADNYVLCDKFFSSEMGPSGPNHLYLVAGQSQSKNLPPFPITFDPIFKELDSAGVSWRVYQATTGTLYQQFQYVQSQSSSYQAEHFAAHNQFAKDLSAKNLRQISWIIGAPGGDEHPPQNITLGEDSVANDIVNPVGNSSYWDSVAISRRLSFSAKALALGKASDDGTNPIQPR